MEAPRGSALVRAASPAAAILAALALTGCAVGAGGPSPSTGGAPVGGRPGAPAPPPSSALGRVEDLVSENLPDSAAILADSLYFAWRVRSDTRDRAAEALWREAGALEAAGRPGAVADRLRELLSRFPGASSDAAVRLLAKLEIREARDPAAANLLLAHPSAVNDSARALLRSAASHMSTSELLEALAGGKPSGQHGAARPPSRDRDVLLTALARELARSGRADSASRVAARVLASDAADPERRLAGSVRAGDVESFSGPLVLGVILPESGRFAAVGTWLREGIDLAVEQASGEAGPTVELRVVDEGDDPAAVPGLVRDLEEAGAVAIVGPVRSRALADASAAREDPGLALVSPTATDAPDRAPEAPPLNAYALWDSRRRQIDAVRDLGQWLGARVEAGPAAILFARNPSGVSEALAFRAGLAPGRGTVVMASFDPDSTTFRSPIARVGSFTPRTVFVAGGSTGTLLQLAPQLSYFGAGGALVAGGPTWSRPQVVRRLEPSPTQERIVATYLDWSDPASGWSRFRALYEKKYHKSLGNNVVPALGYDAARLVLAALPADGLPQPRATARRLASLTGVKGATGTLSPDAATSTVARRTLVRILQNRSLAPASPDSVSAWLGRSGFLEAAGLRRQRAAARQAVREAVADSATGGRP